MKRSLLRRMTVLFAALCIMASFMACGEKGNGDNVVFHQVKTSGIVQSVSPDKITMTVSADDANFKKGAQVVVTFKNIYLSRSQSKSDVLTKTDKLEAGDSVYVIYSDDQRKEDVINVNDIVKEEAK